jgi:predicted MPP superfamily phosphohydrolase
MRTINFIIFFSIFFIIYGLINYYIFIRGLQAIPHTTQFRITYVTIFIIFAGSFIFGRILENIWLSPVSSALIWIGSFWLAAMLYFLLIVIMVDIIRMINHWFPFIQHIGFNYGKMKLFLLWTSISLVSIIIIIGHINAANPIIKTLTLSIAKKSSVKKLNIVAATDIHLGTIINKKRFCNIVNKINQLNPDIVLLPGDIVDEDLAPIIKENIGDALTKIKAKFGVIASTGNHEYIGGVERSVQYLSDHGVVVLRDTAIKINGNIYIVGREDRSISQFTGKQRKPLHELIEDIDKEFPVILLDHQPFGLMEAVNLGIDLQISGHTHHGQLWPLNYITNAVYEVSRGYKKINNTHIYVSNGAGTWGPPVRIGNRPEIVHIKLEFNSQ